MRPLICLVLLSVLAVPSFAQETSGASTRVYRAPELKSDKISLLRTKGILPFTRDVEAITEGIKKLAVQGSLSQGAVARISQALKMDKPQTLKTAELVNDLSQLDPTETPKVTFQELANSLTDDELATILKESDTFELPAIPHPGELPPDTESTGIAPKINDILNPTGQVVEGTQVPKELPVSLSLDSLAAVPGLDGLTTETEEIDSCSKIAEEYNRLLEQVKTHPSDDELKLKRVELGHQVDVACFKEVPQPHPSQLDVFGLLEMPGGELWCSAVLTSSSTIVTARHCLFDDETGDRRTIDWSLISFRPWIDPQLRIPLESVRVPAGVLHSVKLEFLPQNDVVEAKLVAPLPNDPPKVCWDNIRAAAEPLGLFGQFPDALTADPADWPAKIRLSTGGTCVAKEPSQGCFVHFCNAVPGFSGAPVFGLPNTACPTGVRVVGLHVAKGRMSIGCSTSRGNEGISASQISSLLGL